MQLEAVSACPCAFHKHMWLPYGAATRQVLPVVQVSTLHGLGHSLVQLGAALFSAVRCPGTLCAPIRNRVFLVQKDANAGCAGCRQFQKALCVRRIGAHLAHSWTQSASGCGTM